MMYTLVEKMTKVSHFLIIRNKKLLVCDGVFNVDSHIYNVLPILFQTDITEDNVWIKDNNWENYLLKISDNSIKKLDFNLGLNGAISNVLVIFKDNVQSCFSTIENSIIVNFPKIDKIKNYLSNDKSIFFQVETILKSLSLLTSEYEWEEDLREYGEIRKIIGVSGGNLWVSLNKDIETKTHTLLYLNIQTGVVQKHFEHDYHFSDFGVILSESQQTIVSLKGGVGSQRTWFYEYDALIGSPLRDLEVPSLKEKKLGVKSFTVYKDLIYFTATDDTQIVANTVGVLDYKTLELLWYEKVHPGNLILDPPQVTDDKIYVLGAEGTLHIFEKEV